MDEANSLQTISEAAAVNDELDTEKYGIFIYFKDHPGVLATAVSAVIAVIAFVFNIVLYQRACTYLRYWGFSPDNVSITTANQIYILAIALIYFIAVSCIQIFLLNTYSVHQHYTAKNYSLKRLTRVSAKFGKNARKKLRRAKRELFWIELWHGKLDRVAQLKSDVNEQMAEQNKIDAGVKAAKKDCRKLYLLCFKSLLPSLLTAFVLSFIFVYIFFAFSAQSIRYFLPLSLCTSLLTLFIPYLFIYLPKIRPLKKKIRASIKHDDASFEEIFSSPPKKDHRGLSIGQTALFEN